MESREDSLRPPPSVNLRDNPMMLLVSAVHLVSTMWTFLIPRMLFSVANVVDPLWRLARLFPAIAISGLPLLRINTPYRHIIVISS